MITDSTIAVITLVVLLLIFVVFTYEAHASDYFANFSQLDGWSYEPIICILDPPKHKIYTVLEGATLWQNLFNFVGLEGYDYNVFVLDEQDDKCNITIKFVPEEVVISNGGTPLGVTLCSESPNIYHQLGDIKRLIRLGERDCYILINPDWNGGDYLQPIIVHEVGHALGIGHRQSSDQGGFAYVIETNDIMNPALPNKPVVTEESLDALQYFYNYSGWNGVINHDSYIVPHI